MPYIDLIMQNTPELIDILEQRKTTGYQPGSNSDGHTLTLWISGGGAACARAYGMALELHNAGLLEFFDNIGGASGGACIAAVAASGELDKFEDFYPNTFSSPEFTENIPGLNMPYRMNLEWVFGEVLREGDYALDTKTIFSNQAAGQKLFLSGMREKDGRCVIMSDFFDEDDLFCAMHASSNANPLDAAVTWRDEKLVDGGWGSGGVPLSYMENQLGSTHIMMLDAYAPEQITAVADRKENRSDPTRVCAALVVAKK